MDSEQDLKPEDTNEGFLRHLASELRVKDPDFIERLRQLLRESAAQPEVESWPEYAVKLRALMRVINTIPDENVAMKAEWCEALMVAMDMAGDRERAIEALADPEKLTLEYENREARIELKHWAVKLFAISFAKTIAEAKNFVTMEVGPVPETGERLEVTIKRKEGKSTAEVLGELRAELAAKDDRIAQLEAENAELRREIVNAIDDDDM